MSYGEFAYLYDILMEDVPYERWVDWVKSAAAEHQAGNRILDLACGTGELSVRLSEAGFDVSGVDLSDDMLAVAHAKAQENGLSIPFFQQDMTELEQLGEFDMIGIFCDSLNYLPDEQSVGKTFAASYRHLKQGGLFLFDVHSIYKMDHVFSKSPFTYVSDDISYIWDCSPGEAPYSVEHDLTFFALDDASGRYDRFDEMHYQRTYPVQIYEALLEKAGFRLLSVTGDFGLEPPGESHERLFFTAQKK